MPTTKEEAQLTSAQRRLERAFRPFTMWRYRAVRLHVAPPPIKTAVILIKPSLYRQWEYDGWLRRGALIAQLDSYVPVNGLQRIVAAITAFTTRIAYIGDLAPEELAMFVRVKSVMPPSVRLTYAGVDDEWLAKEKKSRRGSGSPYYEMDQSEARLWRALKEARPSIVKLIGPNATAVLDRGDCLAIEGACAIGWHGHTMLNLAFRRAMGRAPPRVKVSRAAEEETPEPLD